MPGGPFVGRSDADPEARERLRAAEKEWDQQWQPLVRELGYAFYGKIRAWMMRDARRRAGANRAERQCGPARRRVTFSARFRPRTLTGS